MKITGEHFTNSDTCEGIAFTAAEALIDLARITITGRYPESGWAINETAQEMVYVEQGSGSLTVEGEDSYDLKAGDVAFVASGKWFAWEGDMVLVMACQPPFNPAQYRQKEA